MPLYLDIHRIVGGITMDAVAEAHKTDLQLQWEHDVSFLRYWVDERRGRVFCLVEAPNEHAAAEVHRKGHGLVADEIFQVLEGC